MLTIRREQMRILTAPFFEQFVRRGISHVQKHFGDQFVLIGEPEVRRAVLHAVERAESYGLTTDEHVLLFVTLMFAFGRNFDRDLSWASETLRAPERNAGIRMSRLRALALSHQKDQRGYLALKEPSGA
jgi:hypothetical protein